MGFEIESMRRQLSLWMKWIPLVRREWKVAVEAETAKSKGQCWSF